MSILKNLYTQLMGHSWHEDWHKNHEKFYKEVEEIRNSLSPEKHLSPQDRPDHYCFLERLILLNKEHPITPTKRSHLSKVEFKLFIGDPEFRESLEKLICNPDIKDNFTEFDNVWSKLKKKVKPDNKHNPARVNRVVVACTHNVSRVVDYQRFNFVFSKLRNKGIIKPSEDDLENWFSKNQCLMKEMHREFSEELYKKKIDGKNIDAIYLSIFVWELHDYFKKSPFSIKTQIVKYGPPGTGKTYKAKEDARDAFNSWQKKSALGYNYDYDDQYKLVQFHPSFSYEDFIEGLRPVLESGQVQLKLQNGIFKKFCMKAGKWEIDIYKLKHRLKLDFNWESLTIGELIKHKEEDELKEEDKLKDHWKDIFDSKASPESKVMDVVPPFFFIIDEINRSELSRVFGELMYCLEYRGVDGKIKTQYANLNNEKTGMLKINEDDYHFFIPTNIYLIGTMNTIDRSVESFDLALRRRFLWQEVPPDIELLRYHLNDKRPKWDALADNLEDLNKEITESGPLLGRDYTIGHAYLMNMNYDKDLDVEVVRKYIWKDSILPLLQEYLRGSGKENDLIGSPEKAGTLKKAFFKKK